MDAECFPEKIRFHVSHAILVTWSIKLIVVRTTYVLLKIWKTENVDLSSVYSYEELERKQVSSGSFSNRELCNISSYEATY
jgi:hypothetical protein